MASRIKSSVLRSHNLESNIDSFSQSSRKSSSSSSVEISSIRKDSKVSLTKGSLSKTETSFVSDRRTSFSRTDDSKKVDSAFTRRDSSLAKSVRFADETYQSNFGDSNTVKSSSTSSAFALHGYKGGGRRESTDSTESDG